MMECHNQVGGPSKIVRPSIDISCFFLSLINVDIYKSNPLIERSRIVRYSATQNELINKTILMKLDKILMSTTTSYTVYRFIAKIFDFLLKQRGNMQYN